MYGVEYGAREQSNHEAIGARLGRVVLRTGRPAMIVRETGKDEFTIKLSRAEATQLKTCARVAMENDGRAVTDWSRFAEVLNILLFNELAP